MSAAPAEQVAVLSRMKRSGSLEIKVRYDLRYGCYGHQCGWGRISKFAELCYRLKRGGACPWLATAPPSRVTGMCVPEIQEGAGALIRGAGGA